MVSLVGPVTEGSLGVAFDRKMVPACRWPIAGLVGLAYEAKSIESRLRMAWKRLILSLKSAHSVPRLSEPDSPAWSGESCAIYQPPWIYP